jgi:hypothetical protein
MNGASGEVKLRIVLAVLEAHNVDVSKAVEGGWRLAKDDLLEICFFPDPVHRRTLHWLSRKYGIPIHHFYRPELMKDSPTGKDLTRPPS